jgi:hypothetical protein
MFAPFVRSTRFLGLVGGALAVTALVAGCVTGSGAAAPPDGTPSATPSSGASEGSSPSPTPDATFYLRAWQTQALAPQYTFGVLPQVTISGGVFINGIIAVPAIYPGPLWVQPVARTISQAGIDAIVAEARKDGLFDGQSEFIDQALMGGVDARLQMVVDGKMYDLTGDPTALTRCNCTNPDPGTAAAFAAFWQKLTGLDLWLPADLGPSASYEPDRLAVLAMPPSEPASGITAGQVTWPLATPFSKFGTAMGNDTFRCGVVSGADLASLLPVVKQSSQITRFVDSEGTVDSLVVRALVPGEPSPCA